MERNIIFTLVLITFLCVAVHLPAQRNSSISESYNHEVQGNYREAINVMLRFEKNMPKDPFFKLRLGWLHFLLKDYLQAENYYRQSLELSVSTEAMEGLMNSLYYQGQWLKTIQAGKQILERFPDSFTALTAVAYSHYVLKDYANASQYYQRAADIYPYNLEVIGYLLSSYHLNNEEGKARDLYKKLSLYSPENLFIVSYKDIYDR